MASGTLYASVADLRNVMDATDSGTGTAAQLTDAQLTLALYAGSNRVSVFAGNIYDSSVPEATPPGILHDLALDLACFWAYKTYLKSKVIAPDHPVYIAYRDASAILEDVRDGKILLDPAVAPGDRVRGRDVINRIPPVFTGKIPTPGSIRATGILEADVPSGQWAPRGVDWADGGGAWYQG